MTREELRDYVDEQRALDNIPYHVYSALIDGIDTLEQEPCEDAISRKAVLNQIFYSTDNNGDVVLGSALRGRIARLPSVTPQLSSRLEKNSKKLEKDFGELDCISRADVNQVIEDYMDEQYDTLSDRTRERAFGAKTVMARINELPSVTPRPREGHWITDAKTYYEELNKRGLGVDEYTPYFTDDIACSECLAKYSMLDNETQFFKYCPNCGADMREVKE